MALRAGYYGLKKKLLEKVTGIPAIKSIGSGLALNSSTGELSATGVEVSIEGNPEGEATAGNLTKLQIGNDIFNVPDTTYSNATTENAGLMSAADKTKLNGLDKDAYFLRSEQAVLGAKNLLPNNASNKTDGNVAWVVNADKSITINTSASASSVQSLQIGEVTGLQGDYILNGVTGGSTSTFGIQLYDVTTSTWTTQYAVDGDSTINLADKTHTYRFTAYVRQGVEVSNKTIYPMLRLASDPDDTYAPHAMTNRVLTEKSFYKLISSVSLNDIVATGKYELNGTISDGPGPNYGLLFVIAMTNENSIRQIVMSANGANVWTRIRYNGTWESWKQFQFVS